MAQIPTRGRGILALALLLVAFVAVDAARRFLRPRAAPTATREQATGAAVTQTASGSARRPPPAPASGGLDADVRAAALRRVSEEGARTYLPAMLAAEDSAVRRWGDDRTGRPLRVGVASGNVQGFRETFVANVTWAVARWNGVGLPISIDESGDTAGADIVVTWAERLDSNRTGRSDVTWQRGGAISHVHVVLATHTPDGQPVNAAMMVALALHELGHALGLGHSPVATDALYPETSATDLTERDRRTALLLYSLPPGSLK